MKDGWSTELPGRAMLQHGLPLLVGAILAVVAPKTCLAQTVAPGSRVRVTAPEMALDRQHGRLLWLDADSLVLESAGADLGARDAAPVRWVVPRDLLAEVENSQGRRGHPWKGLLIGTAVGLTVGLIETDFGKSTVMCSGSGDYRTLCAAVIGGFTVGGSVLGLVVGSLVRTERWSPVPLPGS